MNNEVKKFLDEVCGYIKYKGIHNEIKEELEMHIEELAESYKTRGLSEDEAIKRSIARTPSIRRWRSMVFPYPISPASIRTVFSGAFISMHSA